MLDRRTPTCLERVTQRRHKVDAIYLGKWLTRQRPVEGLSLEELSIGCQYPVRMIAAIEAGLIRIDSVEFSALVAALNARGQGR